MVVYEHVGVGIKTARVLVNPTGTPSVAATSTVVVAPALGSAHSPAISRTNLFEDQYLIAYTLSVSTGAEIRALLVSGQGLKLFDSIALTATPSVAEMNPEVDGDGRDFVVAWSTSGPTFSVRATKVEVSAAGLDAGSEVDPIPEADYVVGHSPRVAWVPGKALITSSVPVVASQFFPAVVGLSAQTLAVCETPQVVSASMLSEPSLTLAAVSSGGVLGDDRALLAWSTPAPLDVLGQLVDATGPGGGVVNLGGGCGQGGMSSVPGPIAIGNGYLQVLLSGADPSASLAILNVAIGVTPPLVCGACAWTPFQFTATQNMGGGGTGHVLSVPCDTGLIGAKIDTQWTVVTPGTNPCSLFPGFSLSNALRLTIAF